MIGISTGWRSGTIIHLSYISAGFDHLEKVKIKKKLKPKISCQASFQNPPVPDSVPSVSDKWAFDRVVMSPCYHTGSDEDLVAHLDASRQYDKCLLADSVSTGLRA